MTRVALGSSDVAGVLNLRGRIVTAIRHAFPAGMPKRDTSGARTADGGSRSICAGIPMAS